MMLTFETIEPPQSATAAVILLHGLGANGHDLMSLVPLMPLPQAHTIRFIFPHAPVRPVTVNQGIPMPAWYDISGFSFDKREDLAGLESSRFMIEALIQHQVQQGISPERIILGGFSQGGALSLFTGLQLPYPLAALLVLSAYFPCAQHVSTHLGPYAKKIPIFMAHGYDDSILPLRFGQLSKEVLESEGYAVQWHTYPMDHSVCPEEIKDISRWVQKNIMVMG